MFPLAMREPRVSHDRCASSCARRALAHANDAIYIWSCRTFAREHSASTRPSIYCRIEITHFSDMGFYELSLVVRRLPKKDVIDCLKRVAQVIWNQDGIIKRIDYFGYRQLPYTINSDEFGKSHEGSYFVYQVSLGSTRLKLLRPELKLNLDLLNTSLANKNESVIPQGYECTLDEEFEIPIKRRSVRDLVKYNNVRTEPRK